MAAHSHRDPFPWLVHGEAMNQPQSGGRYHFRPPAPPASPPAGPAGSRTAFQRKSHQALAFLALAAALFLWTLADAASLRTAGQSRLARQSALVRDLGLSDLCLFPEARYTRHLSQADRHSAFQDHPTAFEHFPSGSLVAPPSTMATPHANLDRKTKIPD